MMYFVSNLGKLKAKTLFSLNFHNLFNLKLLIFCKQFKILGINNVCQFET